MSAANKARKNEEMKRLLSDMIEELHQKARGSIGDLLRFKVIDCDSEVGEYCFLVDTAEWMQNFFGALHGGIIATVLDQGMGMLGICITERKCLTPSVQLNVTYHRPLNPGNQIMLKIYVVSVSKTLLCMRAEAMQADQPEKLCVTGNGIYYLKPLSP